MTPRQRENRPELFASLGSNAWPWCHPESPRFSRGEGSAFRLLWSAAVRFAVCGGVICAPPQLDAALPLPAEEWKRPITSQHPRFSAFALLSPASQGSLDCGGPRRFAFTQGPMETRRDAGLSTYPTAYLGSEVLALRGSARRRVTAVVSCSCDLSN